MHSLEPEVSQLHAAGVLDEPTAARLQALENGTIFSLHYELRIASYAAVLLVVAGVGLMLKENFDRIGPMAIATVVALLAAGCYAWVARGQLRGEPRSIVGDYLLLLGGMLISADVAFLEVQFHWLGNRWALHLLLLAALHAVCAYAFDSRLLLSLALTALAGWFGASTHLDDLFRSGYSTGQYGTRALLAAASVFVWRIANQVVGSRPQFNEVLEHFAINFALWGGVLWCTGDHTLLAGALLTAVLSAWVIRLSLQRRNEWFAVYGVLYGAVGLCIVLVRLLREPVSIAMMILFTVTGAVMLLRGLHRHLKDSSP